MGTPSDSEMPGAAQEQPADPTCGAFIFGPQFFRAHLGGIVKEQCAGPAEAMPAVQIHLVDGQVLDVCHVVALAPRWLALAVLESLEGMAMHLELVPYQLIARVSIRHVRASARRIGFDGDHTPEILEGGAWLAAPAGGGRLRIEASPT